MTVKSDLQCSLFVKTLSSFYLQCCFIRATNHTLTRSVCSNNTFFHIHEKSGFDETFICSVCVVCMRVCVCVVCVHACVCVRAYVVCMHACVCVCVCRLPACVRACVRVCVEEMRATGFKVSLFLPFLDKKCFYILRLGERLSLLINC